MDKLKTIFIGILLLAMMFFVWDRCTRKDEVIEIPIEIEVPVPVVERYTDTIEKPVPVYINNPINKELLSENQDLLDKFNKADSLLKIKQYEDAISIREYKETFEDTFQTIDVYTKTRGEMLQQYVHYKTKPRTIKIDTTIITTVKGKFKVFGLIEGGTNVISVNPINKVIGKGTIIFKNSKDNGISVGIDTQGNGYLGYMFKF